MDAKIEGDNDATDQVSQPAGYPSTAFRKFVLSSDGLVEHGNLKI